MKFKVTHSWLIGGMSQKRALLAFFETLLCKREVREKGSVGRFGDPSLSIDLLKELRRDNIAIIIFEIKSLRKKIGDGSKA